MNNSASDSKLKTSNSQQKIALITGCSSGFGLLTAIEMAKAGFRVFASMRNLSKRANLDAAAREANVQLEIVELDVTKDKSIADAVNSIYAKAGRIDVLVNNAGIVVEGFVEDSSISDFRDAFETNFFGVIMMTKAVYPKMREQHSGRIINISSVAGLIGLPNSSAYVASKFAIEGFTESLYYEGQFDGINVSLIEPGVHKTEIRAGNMKFGKGVQDTHSPHYALSKQITANFDEFFQKNGLEARYTVRKVVEAATTNKPKLRYRICSNTEVVNFLLNRILPFSVFAKLVLMQMAKK